MSCSLTTIDELLAPFAAEVFDLPVLGLFDGDMACDVDVVAIAIDTSVVLLLLLLLFVALFTSVDDMEVLRFNELRFSLAVVVAVLVIKSSGTIEIDTNIFSIFFFNLSTRRTYLFELLSAAGDRPLQHICLWSKTNGIWVSDIWWNRPMGFHLYWTHRYNVLEWFPMSGAFSANTFAVTCYIRVASIHIHHRSMCIDCVCRIWQVPFRNFAYSSLAFWCVALKIVRKELVTCSIWTTICLVNVILPWLDVKFGSTVIYSCRMHELLSNPVPAGLKSSVFTLIAGILPIISTGLIFTIAEPSWKSKTKNVCFSIHTKTLKI